MWVYICQGDKMKVTKGRGYVYSIQYHVVWCVKYRYKVLMDDIEKDLTDIIKNIAKDNHINILEMNMDKDHKLNYTKVVFGIQAISSQLFLKIRNSK